MNTETKDRLADFFSAADLIEYLEESDLVTVEDIIDIFDEEIIEVLEEIEELMGVSRD